MLASAVDQASSTVIGEDRIYGLVSVPVPELADPWDVYERYYQALEIGLPELIEEERRNVIRHLPYDTQVDLVEELMKQFPQIELEARSTFRNDLYYREMTIPAGTLLTSKIHTQDHICIVSKGSITVVSNEHETVLIEAPFIFASKAGSRRVGLAHEETVWTTVHDVDGLMDVPAIEELLFKVRVPDPIVRQLVGTVHRIGGSK